MLRFLSPVSYYSTFIVRNLKLETGVKIWFSATTNANPHASRAGLETQIQTC